MFRLLSSEERAKIAKGLLNEGRYRIVTDEEKIWVIKHNNYPDSLKRDLLGFLLGKGIFNIPEVRLLNNQQLEEIKQFASQGESFDINNTFLVRLAHSYSSEELPCKTIEEAVATELVYSIWIRRRDAHIDNRTYVKGIPIFFDFHIAFLGESDLVDINVFFSQTQDHGRAGLWRVKVWTDFLGQFTGTINPIEIGAYHFVNDLNSFYQYVNKSKTILKENIANRVETLVHQVNFTGATETQVIDLLKRNLATLDGDVSKMLEIVRKD